MSPPRSIKVFCPVFLCAKIFSALPLTSSSRVHYIVSPRVLDLGREYCTTSAVKMISLGHIFILIIGLCCANNNHTTHTTSLVVRLCKCHTKIELSACSCSKTLTSLHDNSFSTLHTLYYNKSLINRIRYFKQQRESYTLLIKKEKT